MGAKPLILIAEDEEGIRHFMSTILETNGYATVPAATARDALQAASSRAPELVLLDLGLPDADGIEVLRTIRSWPGSPPVIVVSARGHEREKVEALDLGADDYIVKPFGPSELLARIRTALRHARGAAGTAGKDGGDAVEIGELRIDFERRMLTVAGREVHLTPIEYRIVTLLARNAGKVITHGQIIREVWGPYASESQALRVNMANIRRKIEDNPAEPRYIRTEVGVGYRMAEQ